jgi:hypothetical protein
MNLEELRVHRELEYLRAAGSGSIRRRRNPKKRRGRSAREWARERWEKLTGGGRG